MKALAESLSILLGRSVRERDRAGWRIRLQDGLGSGFHDAACQAGCGTRTGNDGRPPPGVAPILTALTETLGLRLQPKKGPVAVFVIEKIERPGQN